MEWPVPFSFTSTPSSLSSSVVGSDVDDGATLIVGAGVGVGGGDAVLFAAGVRPSKSSTYACSISRCRGVVDLGNESGTVEQMMYV